MLRETVKIGLIRSFCVSVLCNLKYSVLIAFNIKAFMAAVVYNNVKIDIVN